LRESKARQHGRERRTAKAGEHMTT
jgi:hypothetical protein